MADWFEISWYGKDSLNGFQFDYSPSRGIMRVSYFIDGHFKDEAFFDIDAFYDIDDEDIK